MLARKGYAERPSIVGDDVLGWALARNGECREALRYSERSLRLGTQDPVKLFHRGWIAACLGDRATARGFYRRALALNPQLLASCGRPPPGREPARETSRSSCSHSRSRSLAPVAAQAHPLGNFTINRFARVEVAGHRLYVRYVLDMAEIPTYQARQQGVDAERVRAAPRRTGCT